MSDEDVSYRSFRANRSRHHTSMPIPYLDDCDNFEEYRELVDLWELCTDIDELRRAPLLFSSIPTDSKKFGGNLRKKLMKVVKPTTLATDPEGVKKIMAFLEDKIGKSEHFRQIEVFTEFYDYIKTGSMTISEYISGYEEVIQLAAANDIAFNDNVKAFMLLKKAKMSDIDYKMVMTGVNVKKNFDAGTLYKEIKDRMTDVLSNAMGQVTSQNDAFLTNQDHEVLVANGWRPPRKGNYKTYQKLPSRDNSRDNRTGKGLNPIGAMGKRLLCHSCGSNKHLLKDCQDSYENKKKQDRRGKEFDRRDKKYRYRKPGTREAYVADNREATSEESFIGTQSDSEEDRVPRYNRRYVDSPRRYRDERDRDSSKESHRARNMHSVHLTTDKSELSKFTSETINCAAMDTCCTANVAGKKWTDIFIQSMTDKMKTRIEGPFKSDTTFRFGNQGELTSIGYYRLPVKIGGENYKIEVDIINSDIPLLLSKNEMKRLGIGIDMKRDIVTINDKPLVVNTTSAGHYIIDLLDNGDVYDMNQVLMVDIKRADVKEQKKVLEKLHAQFGHKSKQSFVNLLKAADKWDDTYSKMIDNIIDGCEGCVLRRKTPDRPVVAMNMANDFNQRLSVDLKIWGDKYILYMIDVFTRFTVGEVIKNKQPETIVNKIMRHWVKYFGIMGGLISDNGGEFTSHLMNDVTSQLGVSHFTTGAEAPWQNGCNERNHAVCDSMLHGVLDDHPNMSLDTALAWACTAKNTLANVYGYSPYQLVLGQNPRLPNILEDTPPMWEVKSMSKKLTEHLTALHSTRKEFIKSESCEKIKKALKHRIRTSDTIYQYGDIVYYKRENEDRWKGPATVMFQDAKVIYVRHGGFGVKVSANRIVKAKDELVEKIKRRNGDVSITVQRVSAEKEDDKSKDKDRARVSEERGDKYIPELYVEERAKRRQQKEEQRELRSRSAQHENEEAAENHLPEEIGDEEAAENHLPEEIGDEEATENCIPGEIADEQQEMNRPNRPTRTQARSKTISKRKMAVKLDYKKNDRVEWKIGDKWYAGTVTGRAGKANGKAASWMNIQLDNGDKPFSTDILGTDNIRKTTVQDENTIEDNEIERDEEEINWVMVRLDNGSKPFATHTADKNIRKMMPEDVLYSWAHEEVMAVMLPKEKRNTPECLAAKEAELDKLKSFETYEVVKDKGQDHITTTWVLTEKGDEIRARLTARGYEETEEFPKDSPTMQKPTLRILLTLATLFGWVIQAVDVASAFLQGNRLDRLVYVKPPVEANEDGKLWKLLKCLYGLKDASRQWYSKVETRLLALNFKKSKYDPGFFYLIHGGKLIGMIGIHVDDFLQAGSQYFKSHVIPEVIKSFRIGKSEEKEFMYTGFNIRQDESGITLDQSEYVKNIQIPNLEAIRLKEKEQEMNQNELSMLRQMVGSLNWAVRATRPDLCFEMIDLSTKFKGGLVKDLCQARKILTNLQRNMASIRLSNVKNLADCQIWCYSDSAFRNINEKQDSAGGYVILLVNSKTGKCAPLDWRANKIKRKVASTLAAEAISLGTALDAAIAIRDMLLEITNAAIDLQIKGIVDNKSTRDAVYSSTCVAERQLRAEIAIIKELKEEKIVSEVKWVRGQHMLADVMTKRGVNPLPLITVLQQGKIDQELLKVCME